jgi:hypothetical protein
MGLANSLALRLAGITANTPDPPGGTVVRDAKGNPTGALKDAAIQLGQCIERLIKGRKVNFAFVWYIDRIIQNERDIRSASFCGIVFAGVD